MVLSPPDPTLLRGEVLCGADARGAWLPGDCRRGDFRCLPSHSCPVLTEGTVLQPTYTLPGTDDMHRAMQCPVLTYLYRAMHCPGLSSGIVQAV
eukprot:890602-Rhodomonas_salina.1